MGDLIDRQTAIEMIVNEANKPGAYGYVDAKSIVDLLNKLPTEQRWIPCSERLPEEGKELSGLSRDVLVAVLDRDNKDVFVAISHTLDGKWMTEPSQYFKVIAWMPLPEPYR